MESLACPASSRETTATVVFARGQAQSLSAAVQNEIRLLAYQKWDAAGQPDSDGIRFCWTQNGR